jgi:hypothetical protein
MPQPSCVSLRGQAGSKLTSSTIATASSTSRNRGPTNILSSATCLVVGSARISSFDPTGLRRRHAIGHLVTGWGRWRINVAHSISVTTPRFFRTTVTVSLPSVSLTRVGAVLDRHSARVRERGTRQGMGKRLARSFARLTNACLLESPESLVSASDLLHALKLRSHSLDPSRLTPRWHGVSVKLRLMDDVVAEVEERENSNRSTTPPSQVGARPFARP